MSALLGSQRRAGLFRRGVFVALALAASLGPAEAKIVLPGSGDPPPAAGIEKPPTIQGDTSVHVNYYLFGAIPSWWNQQSVNLPRQGAALATLGTRSITRGALHDAIALRLAREAEQHAVIRNKAITWSLKGTLLHGLVSPLRTFHDGGGLLCRDFRHTVTLNDGSAQVFGGTACRALEGAWLLRVSKNIEDTVKHSTAH